MSAAKSAAANCLLRVVKLGGSLLALDDWPRRLLAWLSEQPPAANVLIVGGGKLADCLRDYDRRFALGEEAAHELCIQVLSLHAELAATLLGRILPDVRLVRTTREIHALRGKPPAKSALAVLDPDPFLSDEEPHLSGTRLPHTWQATTDSIAARLAECLAADELVLLKSAPPPTGPWHDYVDPHFPFAVSRAANLRFVDLHGRPQRHDASSGQHSGHHRKPTGYRAHQ